MNLTIEQVPGNIPVVVLSTHGDLDASNYQELINRTRELHATGVRHLILDMADTPFMSSSGLVALHTVALLMQGQSYIDPDSGWEALRAVGRSQDRQPQSNVKLLKIQPQVRRALEKTGLDTYFEFYSDKDAALSAFSSG
jgi:anti-anti-sigma factor